MMLGPCRAPSSPPEMPAPRNRSPCPASDRSRRLVSSKCELPPSTSTSPGSRWGASSSRTASTGGPALTITRMRRGRASAATSSSNENAATIRPSSPWRSSRSRVRVAVRLWTATGKPCLAALRARFWPMVARPVTPRSHCSAMPTPSVAPCRLGTLPGCLSAMQAPRRPPPAGVRGVLVTHIHPDHYGLAGKVRELSGAWVALHPADAANVPDRHQDVDDLLARIVRWLAATGAPADDLDQLRDATMQLRRFVVVARAEVPGWDLRALHTPGHTPGHLCFVEARAGVVLTGDHVLATISPNVSSHPQSGPDPLGDYLASLARLRAHGGLDALPGHQWRFGGLGERIGELLAHPQVRLADAEALVAGGAETAYQVAPGRPWSRPFPQLRGLRRRAAPAARPGRPGRHPGAGTPAPCAAAGPRPARRRRRPAPRCSRRRRTPPAARSRLPCSCAARSARRRRPGC